MVCGGWLLSSHLFMVSASQDLGKFFHLIAILLNFNKKKKKKKFYTFSLIILLLIAEDLIEGSPGINKTIISIKRVFIGWFFSLQLLNRLYFGWPSLLFNGSKIQWGKHVLFFLLASLYSTLVSVEKIFLNFPLSIE